MRCLAISLIAIPMSLVLGVGAAAAETEDRPLRAAYCIGVIEEQIAANKAQPPAFAVCQQWQAKKFASQDACNAAGQRVALSSLESQLNVYKQYLALRLRALSPYATAQTGIRQKQGALDTRAMRARAPTPQEQQCIAACKGKNASSCVAGCYDREHPTDASVIRCGSDAPF